jgi:hypothetical protein
MLTYEELLAECEMHGLTLVPKECPKPHKFTAIARFERGFGAEYVNLRSVEAMTIHEAQQLADTQATLYFKSTEDLEGAALNEVRIRPE